MPCVYFQRSICLVTEDKRTSLVTVSIEWKDRKVAADWAKLDGRAPQ
jgi:hypothetical protein